MEEANSTFANTKHAANTPSPDDHDLSGYRRGDFLHMVFYGTASRHGGQLRRSQHRAPTHNFTLATDFPSGVARYNGVTPPADVSKRGQALQGIYLFPPDRNGYTTSPTTAVVLHDVVCGGHASPDYNTRTTLPHSQARARTDGCLCGGGAAHVNYPMAAGSSGDDTGVATECASVLATYRGASR